MKIYKIAIIITSSTSLSSALTMYDIFDYINITSNQYQIQIDFLHTEIKQNNKQRIIHIDSIFYQHSHINYDFIFLPPLKEINPTRLLPDEKFNRWLNIHHKNNHTTLCASCSNVYTFAYANLLYNKSATTHWSLEDDFNVKFTNIHLNIHKLIVDEGRILTSGGGYSYIDLCFYIINKFISHDLAYEVSKYLVVDMGRISQTYFKTLPLQIKNNDIEIERLLHWVDENIDKKISVTDMSNFLSISQKTLIRKFKNCTNMLPLTYLHQLKVEKAKYLLVTGNLSFVHITDNLGYSNPSSFRKLFHKYTNLTPREYRNKFINLNLTKK
ncbi:GlxA family transcriptional regulator [Sulfurimonas sp.]